MVESAARNEVLLVGRLAAPPEDRELPSGDVLSTFRLVVDRRQPRPAGSRAPVVDTIDCVARAAGLRRTAGSWRAGDVVELQGALRRRFFRTPRGAASRYEVDVAKAKRLSRAA